MSSSQARSTWKYQVPRDSSFTWFIAISLILFTSAVFLSALIPRGDELPPLIEVELEGVENEPPPLGAPDAGAGEQLPEPMPPESEKPPEMEQSEPMPEPEPVPEPVVELQPDPAPSFVVPEEPPPPPPPKPVVKPAPKPPKPAQRPPSAPAPGSGITGANSGTRGSPTGQPGGRGGSRSDFLSVPRPKYDATARQRGYQGRGIFLITYQNGRVVSVSTAQSTGVPYLDALTIASLKAGTRVKPGTSGAARYPITWQLK